MKLQVSNAKVRLLQLAEFAAVPAVTSFLFMQLLLNSPAASAQATTVLPTDTAPLPTKHRGPSYVKLNAFELRMLQRLPSKLYLSAITESTFRLETNPFQNASQISTLRVLTGGTPLFDMSQSEQRSILKTLSECNAEQQVFRAYPNLTAGWQFTPRTSVYANYFLIRDSLIHNGNLNSTTQSVGGGIQYDIPIGKTFDLQPNLQFRELYQNGQPNVFDYLPAITLTKQLNRDTTVYANILLQLRGLKPFCAPRREIDPFYTIGFQTQKGRWQVASSMTFVQNFRTPFGKRALAPINNYQIICDFEVARQLFKKYSGLQAFVRAEPVWNLHSGDAPGFSGHDFRLYYGIRASLSKPSLTAALQQIKEPFLKSTKSQP